MEVSKGRVIYDLIEPNKKQYSIPVYQRNYDWSDVQCKKLFFDILKCIDTDKPHFVGSIVRAQLEDDKITKYVIVDGQQRLTTLYLLAKALIDNPEASAIDKERITDWLFNKDKYDPLSIDESLKLKLKPIRSDEIQLTKLITNDFDTIDKSTNIYRNYELFCSLINNELKNNGRYIKDICDGMEHLICAILTLNKSEDNAQEVFESINSTGLELTISDLIRNYVLMTDVDQTRLFETYWVKIENLTGKNKLSSFILNYLNFKTDGFVRENGAYDAFKSLFKSGGYSNETMLIELKHYAQIYSWITKGSSDLSDEVNKSLKGMMLLNQSMHYVFLFHVFDDYVNNVIDDITLGNILRFILNYSIRRLICGIGTNSLRGLYKTLYSRVFEKEENKNHYYDSILCFFKQIKTKDKLISDEEFISGLKNNDIYHKNLVCKYILASLENKISKEKLDITNLTIEHVMPQNSDLSLSWKNMLGSDWENIHRDYLHVLGNLTLTGYNSELSDRPFEEKKKELIANSRVKHLNEDIVDPTVMSWTKDNIITRGNKLALEVNELFKIDEPETIISFKDESYKLYSLDDPQDGKSKRPNYFILEGEEVSSDNFSNMLASVALKLYELNPNILKNIAEENEKIIPWSDIVWFSYDKNIVHGEDIFDKTGIYIKKGTDAVYKLYAIKGLLEKYGIDLEEFQYSAK